MLGPTFVDDSFQNCAYGAFLLNLPAFCFMYKSA